MIICNTYKETAEAIKAMKVRGAPAIGVSESIWAIDKMVKKAEENRDKSIDDIRKLLEDEADRMADEDIEVNRVLFILHMKKILKN